jgi:plastocyanin
MRRRTALAALVAVTLGLLGAGSLHTPAMPVAHAVQVWDVLVGTDEEITNGIVSAQAYFPNPLAITVGDAVNFHFRGFHTVTFLGDQPAPRFEVPGAEAGTLMLNPQAFFPSAPPGTTSVTYDGRGFLNSGAPEEPAEEGAAPPPFTVTFTAAGSYSYVCLIHPGMVARLVVEPTGAAVPETPAQATARGQAQLEEVLATMRATTAAVRFAQPISTEAPGRTTVHSALAGLGQGLGASTLAFLPDQLTVRRGDIVVWTMPDPFEIHTVTFPSGAEPPSFIEPQAGPGGPDAGPPMLVIPAQVVNPAGGDTYTGTGYVNSGILGNGASFALRFDAPAGSYEWLCVVHPFMRGTVAVTEP